jgi:hypothetical protein
MADGPPLQLDGDGDLLVACQRSLCRLRSDHGYLTVPMRIGNCTDVLQTTRTHQDAVVQKMSRCVTPNTCRRQRSSA